MYHAFCLRVLVQSEDFMVSQKSSMIILAISIAVERDFLGKYSPMNNDSEATTAYLFFLSCEHTISIYVPKVYR